VQTLCLFGVEMDSRQLSPLRRPPQSQLVQEHRQPSPPSSPFAAWGQPDTRNSPQEEQQTQDWVSRKRPHLETKALGGLVGGDAGKGGF
jgi:hypothetical protein